MKGKSLLLFFILYIELELAVSKDIEKLSIHEKKIIHNLRHKAKLLRNHIRQYNIKCGPQNCDIICPIQLQPSPNYPSSLPPEVAPPVTKPPTSPTKSTQAPNVPNTPNPNKNSTNPLLHQIAQDLQELHQLSKLIRLDKLSKTHKHILGKHFVIRNKDGKKAYKYRELSALGCYAKCDAMQSSGLEPPLAPGAPGGGGAPGESEGGEEDSDAEEPYHEGEDKPIEITASPPDPERIQLSPYEISIDDDYGPNPYYIEDKKKGRAKSHKFKNNL